MNKNESLEERIENLEKQLSYLAKTVENGSDTDNPSTPSSGENWTTIFDRYDDNLNYGYTGGLVSNVGIVNELPDLQPYSKMRMYFFVNSTMSYVDFDISDDSLEYHALTGFHKTGASVATFYFTVHIRNEKKILELVYGRKVDFTNGKTVAVANIGSTNAYHVVKILVS